MKYLCLVFTTTILILILSLYAFSQKAYYLEPDVIVNLSDSVVIRINDYEGSIQWQKSLDLNVWENIPGATHDTLLFVADTTTYFRAEVIAGECDPFYSDTTGVAVFRIITLPATDVTDSSALSGGNVIADGGAPVTARGVVWSTTPNPTIGNNDGNTSDGSGMGEFTSNLTGLTPETTYYVRAYATNSAGITYGQQESFSTLPAVEEPFEYLLTGEVSKTWKLYRVGSSMGVGPNLELPTEWWSLENVGTRPCAYYHEFTFYNNGDYEFDDKGFMWGEGGVFHEDLVGECIEAIPSNMIGPNGEDLSTWLSGMHTFEYNSNTNMVTLNGLGAWIGLVIIGTDGNVNVPQNSVSFNADIEERDGYDYMHVWFEYDAGYVWSFYYAYYHDPSLEPEVVEEEEDPWGEDLPNITPEEIFITFAARDADNMATIDTVASGSTVIFGVDDPTDASAPKVGKFIRNADIQWQELQFRTSPVLYDIQFDNFDVAEIDIYIPADTEFSDGGLQKYIWFGFADMSETQEWWNSPVQFFAAGEDVVVGAWNTYTFDLTEVKERGDLDMIYLGIGGGGHVEEGIFYVRNLIFL